MTTPDLSKVPDKQTAHEIAMSLGKTAEARKEVETVTAEAKRMSKDYVPRSRAAAISGIPVAALGGDPTMPEELRRFNPGPRVLPTDESEDMSTFTPESAFEKWQEQERLRLQKVLDEEAAEYQWYIKCRECGQHGLYLVRPIQESTMIGPRDWYARYKPKAESEWHKPPLCQWCLHKGNEVQLPVKVVDQWRGTFQALPRWIWKAPKSKDRFDTEGNQRAVLLPCASQNAHIDEIEKRRHLRRAWEKEQAEKKKEAERG